MSFEERFPIIARSIKVEKRKNGIFDNRKEIKMEEFTLDKEAGRWAMLGGCILGGGGGGGAYLGEMILNKLSEIGRAHV